MLGTYKYTYRTYWQGRRVFDTATIRVEVVGESKNCYRVKYLGMHADGSAYGSEHWVGKKKVTLDEAPAVEPRPLPDNIRLPYKD